MDNKESTILQTKQKTTHNNKEFRQFRVFKIFIYSALFISIPSLKLKDMYLDNLSVLKKRNVPKLVTVSKTNNKWLFS